MLLYIRLLTCSGSAALLGKKKCSAFTVSGNKPSAFGDQILQLVFSLPGNTAGNLRPLENKSRFKSQFSLQHGLRRQTAGNLGFSFSPSKMDPEMVLHVAEKGETDWKLAGAAQVGQKGRSCLTGMGLRADAKGLGMPLCKAGLDWSPCIPGRASRLIYNGKSGVKLK